MREIKTLRYGDVVKVQGCSRQQSFGTVSGYARQYNENEGVAAERLEKAVRLGHNVVWLNAQATIISDPPTMPDEVDVELQDGEVVFVDSRHAWERGYWVAKKPGMMTGDNCQLVRPEYVYEVWDGNVGKDSFTMLLSHEIAAHLEFALRDNPNCEIHIVAHSPSEYFKSGTDMDRRP
jgi:hypothetical protein